MFRIFCVLAFALSFVAASSVAALPMKSQGNGSRLLGEEKCDWFYSRSNSSRPKIDLPAVKSMPPGQRQFQAMSASPNGHCKPPHNGDTGLEYFIEDTTLTMQVTPSRGKVTRVHVEVVSPDGDTRRPLSAGWEPGDGIDVRRVRVDDRGLVTFWFKSSFFGRKNGVYEGPETDPFFITYEQLETGDLATLCCWPHGGPGIPGGPVTVKLVPEPSSALMLAFGLAAWGYTRRY